MNAKLKANVSLDPDGPGLRSNQTGEGESDKRTEPTDEGARTSPLLGFRLTQLAKTSRGVIWTWTVYRSLYSGSWLMMLRWDAVG